MEKYESIINKLFDENASFHLEDYKDFLGELTGKYQEQTRKTESTDKAGLKYFKEEFEDFIDSEGNKIALLVYKMPNKSKVEKARSEQRNLVSNYLKDRLVLSGVNQVLVAFYCDKSDDWRLSYVKQEFKLENGKISNELTPAKRYSFLIEQDSKNITVKQRLNTLLKKEILVSDIEEAFSVEKVSKEFFDEYVKLYKKLNTAFENDKIFQKIESESKKGDSNFRENFVKKLLGQIVFLYFLQKKGWLGVSENGKWGEGNKSFLQDLLKECLAGGDPKKELGGKNFFNDYLEHLFYDFLNKNKSSRKEPDYFSCKIPYLNGGLFEPMNGYKWRGEENILLSGEKSNLLFKEVFDTFDDYNFTVYENDPLEQDVAVDPEMLGKVFENLLPENERKGKGAFYTPREIVHYMCKESLKNYVINKTGISEDRINKLFELKDSMLNLQKFNEKLSEDERYKQFGEFIDYAEKIVESLKKVKVVDPAVGSGAFPMGLLKEIVSLRKYLQENILLEGGVSEYQIKKETLENCIYGVDLDPGAVEIAKLRFWLSLVIEEESTDKIDPLPNLDYKIMQGNSLIEDIVIGDTVIKLDFDSSKKITKKEEKEQEKLFGNIEQTSLVVTDSEVTFGEKLQRLKYLHKVFFKETDGEKKKTIKIQIDNTERDLVFSSAEEKKKEYKSEIDFIEQKYKSSGIDISEKDAKQISKLLSSIQSINEMEDNYKNNSAKGFFPWKLHFGEVFNENGGFDIVIGNPPYVRHEEIKEFKPIFALNYETYSGTSDLYCYFYELIGKLLKDNGHGSYITSNKWIKAKYGGNIRNYFKNQTKINEIIDFGGFKVFDTATVDSNIIGFNKGCKKENEFIVVNIKDDFNLDKGIEFYKKDNGFNFSQNNLFASSWSLVEKQIYNLKEKIEFNSGKLIDYCGEPKVGIKTGANTILIVDEKKKNEILGGDPKEDFLFKKLIVGKNIKNYSLKSKSLYLIFPYIFNNETNELDIIDISKYEKLNKYFEDNKLKLSSRATFDRGKKVWYELQQINKNIDFDSGHIVFPDIGQKPSFAYNNGYSVDMTAFIINKDDKFLLSILNSKIIYFYFSLIASKLGASGYRFKNQFINQLPIKNIPEGEQKPFVELVDKILEITKNEDYLEREDLQKQVKILEKKIDEMVYELYDLSPEEIDIVEESLKK